MILGHRLHVERIPTDILLRNMAGRLYQQYHMDDVDNDVYYGESDRMQ